VTAATAPRVSVCIPTYRGAATIGAAIGSVLAQTAADFELVVVDDASPDDTAEVVARFADRRIAYLRNERNLGPEGNWNRCLAEARGRYFKLLPHDDVLHPRCLERQAAVLDADRDERIALVACAREVLDPEGHVLARRGYPGAREGVLDAAAVMRACLRRGTNLLGEPGAVLMRRSLAERVGRFDATEPYVIDLDYWFRLLAHGDAWYCAQALSGFRISASQWSVAIGANQSGDFRRWAARASARASVPTSVVDRLRGRITPTLNLLGRLVYYRLHLR
jgi:glycosyltransferase involved in cell wall biosynthesis